MAYRVRAFAHDLVALNMAKSNMQKRNRIIDDAGPKLIHCIGGSILSEKVDFSV